MSNRVIYVQFVKCILHDIRNNGKVYKILLYLNRLLAISDGASTKTENSRLKQLHRPILLSV